MKEKQIQRQIATQLDYAGVTWCHVPNENKALSSLKKQDVDHYWGVINELKQQGAKPGVPDILIFDKPPNYTDKKGLAMELKSGDNEATDEQMEWLVELANCGWLACVANGIDQAQQKLQDSGYIKHSTGGD